MIKISSMLSKQFLAVSLFLFTLTGCNNQDVEYDNMGQGKFMLDLRTDVTFMTKSVDESYYQNIDNYTVQLYKGSSLVKSFVYGEMPLMNDLEAGSYSIKAFCGENVPAGYDKLYVEGSKDFSLVEGEIKSISFACVPANVKVKLAFSEDFDTYFSDFSIDFKTAALTTAFTMSKADSSKDLYLKVGDSTENLNLKINLVDKAGKQLSPVTANVNIKARDFLTLTLKPNVIDVVGGAINGITITVNSETVDEDINITIPDEYLPA